ncbi:MAG: N-acetyl-gamma-glutamyl-phosphate reductase [Sphingopyxis sp.]|uniref:N-acetyl-gamma-glutamyl-phosphate reductase n=1 Tax=Sphingopyxis sp. TaxID=1908224 RepID=UPI001A42F2A6|nr:N-acetyl-gamma-glutamyl-phosphate reductase [Sphingopyxis sp.]MBL9070325.1 N-acetyl-gamma-glutamyl-phosphate reductase [Sphingopyxis sp.]
MAQTVFIDGAAGTTGLEIAERLAGRSEFSLIALPDAERKDAARRSEALNGADFVILCLPDAAAIEAVAMVNNPAVRIIDASTAHRVAPGWAYGFPELSAAQRGAIATSKRVSNPGCYPTGFLALVAPLVAAGLVGRDARLSVNAVSGYSGGGKELIARFEADDDVGFRSYGLNLAHKHVPEMQRGAGLDHAPLFAPAVVPVYRGMLVEVPLSFDTSMSDAVHDALAEHFRESSLISVRRAGDESELLLRKSDDATDRIELMLYASPDGTQLRLVARLDNLGKGASGACVQNLNLMAGLAETTGLRL